MNSRYSITSDRLKRAKIYDSKLSDNLEKYEDVKIDKSNPYFNYANELRLGNIGSETKNQTEQEFKKRPIPPNTQIKNQTPKIKFIKKAGEKIKKGKSKKINNRKNKTIKYKK
jgi:hypothetical protein